MDAFFDTLIKNYGIFAGISVVLCGYIVKIQNTHSVERKEFNTQHQSNFEVLLKVTNENTEANTGLKSAIERLGRRE